MLRNDDRLVVSYSELDENGGAEEANSSQVTNVQLNVGVASEAVLVGNQLNISAEGSPGTKIAGMVFEQHHHYGTGAPPIKIKPVIKDVKRRLQNTYSRMWLKPLPYLEDHPLKNFYVGLKFESWDLTGQRCQVRNLNMDDVIGGILTNKRYMLVVGDSGCGKTIFLTKLAYDWATGERPLLEAYDLVLFYKLRNLPRNKSLEEELKAEFLRQFEDQLDQHAQLLELFRMKILFLLDGYDELDDGGKTSLNELLNNSSTFKDSWYIVTSKVQTNREFLKNFQHHIRFSKLDPETTNRIIEKYSLNWSDKTRTDLLKKFVKENKLERLFEQTPLLLFVFCANFENYVSGTNRNFSSLIPDMVRNMIVRQLDKDCDTLSESELILRSIGNLFWCSLKQNTCVFSKREELESWFGKTCPLVMSLQVFQPCSDESTFEPLHKSFMDRLACYYLNSNINDVNDSSKMQDSIKCFLDSSENIDIEILHGDEMFLVVCGTAREIKYLVKSGMHIFEGRFELENDCKNLLSSSRYRYFAFDPFDRKCARLDKEGWPNFLGNRDPLNFLKTGAFFLATNFLYRTKTVFHIPSIINSENDDYFWDSYRKKYVYAKECWGTFNPSYEKFELTLTFDEDSKRLDLSFEPFVPLATRAASVRNHNSSLNDLLNVMLRAVGGSGGTGGKWTMWIDFDKYDFDHDFCRYTISKE